MKFLFTSILFFNQSPFQLSNGYCLFSVLFIVSVYIYSLARILKKTGKRELDPLIKKVYFLLSVFVVALVSNQIIAHFTHTETLYWKDSLLHFITAALTSITILSITGILPILSDLKSKADLEKEITQRQLAEAKLQQGEQRFKSLVQEGGDLMGIIDESGIFLYVSPTTLPIAGFAAEMLIGKNAFEFLHPEDLNRLLNCFQKAKTEKRVHADAFRYTVNPGETRWYETVFTNLLDDPAVGGIAINSRDVTDRIEKEQIIKRRNSELDKIFDFSADVICSLDASARFIKVSNASKPTWGYEPAELSGLSFLDLVIDEDLEKSSEIISLITSGTPIIQFENSFNHKEGFRVPLIWTAKWDDEEGVIYCIARNIAEKQRLERSILKEQQRFSRMFLEAPVGMCILKGPDHIFEESNELYSTLTGRKNIRGKSVREVFPELTDQGYFNWLDEAYRSGKTYSGHETPLVVDLEGKGERTTKYINFIYQPYFDFDGNIEGIYYFGIDVTEQVLSREKLERSEEKYRQIVELAKEGIVLIDNQYNITLVNDAICSILGYSKEELTGSSLFSYIDPEWKELLEEHLDAETQHQASTFEMEYRNKQGLSVVVSQSSATILNRDGSVQGNISMITDITQKKNEERVKEAIASKNYQELVKTETDVRNFARSLNQVLEEERSRIAREIHDEFGQQLAAIKMSISSFRKSVSNQDVLKEKLADVVQDIDNTMQSLRSFATELRPGILDTMGLIPSLQWLGKEFEKKSGVPCRVEIQLTEESFEKNFATCYFRICQEALTNILKHACAKNVVIYAYHLNSHFVLEIVDDGIGIIEDKIENPFSMGLIGMKERANIIGGTISIEKGLTGGTMVQLKAQPYAA